MEFSLERDGGWAGMRDGRTWRGAGESGVNDGEQDE